MEFTEYIPLLLVCQKVDLAMCLGLGSWNAPKIFLGFQFVVIRRGQNKSKVNVMRCCFVTWEYSEVFTQ